MQIMKVDPRALKENPDRMRQSKSSKSMNVEFQNKGKLINWQIKKLIHRFDHKF